MNTIHKRLLAALVAALFIGGNANHAIAQAQPAPAEQQLPEVKVPEVRVQESGDLPLTGPTATSSTTGTRIDVNPRQVPQSIAVVGSKLLEEMGARSAADIAYIVSGVSRQTWDGWNSGLVVRGFEIQSNSLVDGLRGARVSGRTSTTSVEDLALFERVEVLKGHSSVLYGRGYVGGTVNFVAKKPQFSRYGAVEGLIGSKDNYRRGTVDLTGPISDTLAYRIVGVAQNHDFTKQDRTIVSPSLLWKTPGGGELLGRYTYSDIKFIEPDNAVLVNGAITRYRRFNDLSVDDEVRTHDLRLTFRQPLSSNWKLVIDTAHSELDRLQEGRSFRPNAPFVSTSSQGSYLRQERQESGRVWRAEMQGSFALVGTQHRVIFGYEDYKRDQDIRRTHNAVFAAGQPVFSPNFAAPNPGPLAFPQRFFSDAAENGVYIADFIDFGDRTHALIGLRHAKFDSTNLITGAKFTDKSATTPSLGLVYDFSSSLSGYASAGRSFDANSGTDVKGGFFDPMRGRQMEVGLKGDAWEKRFNYTVAAFKIVQDNVVTADPANPGFSALLGEVKVKGIEVDLAAQLSSRLTLIAGLTFLGSEVTKNNNGRQGRRMGATPDDSLGLRLSYRADNGWRFGGQVISVSDREGSDFSTFTVPGYTRFDLDASWQTPLRGLSLQANLENITNTEYVSGTSSPTQITLGKPLNLAFRVKYEF